MAKPPMKAFIGFLAGSSVFFSSTAIAATTTAPAQQVNPWAVLGALSGGAPTVAVCGASAASAAQLPSSCVLPVMDAPPPPAPSAPTAAPVGGYGSMPIVLGLLALAAGVGFLLLVNGHDHGNGPAISPA